MLFMLPKTNYHNFSVVPGCNNVFPVLKSRIYCSVSYLSVPVVSGFLLVWLDALLQENPAVSCDIPVCEAL